MNNTGGSSGRNLRLHFAKAIASTRIGGADVLRELSALASIAIDGTSPAQDAVAFALSTIFEQHADDREDRVVTGDDNYLLVASGVEVLSEAVSFVEKGGSEQNAIRLVAALARLTPDRLYHRLPPT